MALLTIQAGATAYERIRRNGLQPSDVKAIFGASGAAKWLAIYGLDRAIFSQWLAPAIQEIKLFGTSVGAFKLATACHADAGAGMDALAERYIQQRYEGNLSADAIDKEFHHIIDAVTGGAKIDEILSHPQLRLGFGTVRCYGGLSSHNRHRQTLSCARASAANLAGRGALIKHLDRVVFHDPRSSFPFASMDGYTTEAVPLGPNNLELALKASGSIPVYMHGIEDIPGAGAGMYRDGGLLDYHPLPGHFWDSDELVLYPHFYGHCKPGWFDKFLPWRKASGALMDQVVMISPSAEFFRQTELGRLPDRGDFKRYAGRDEERIRLWQGVAELSHQLGEAFIQLAASGGLAAQVTRL